ncbi:DUF2478 domain-containing protein [Ruegeria sp. 2012CJ15-1]
MGIVAASFGPHADLLTANKFGKQEAYNACVRALIGEATTLVVLVLTGVSVLNLEAFCQLSAG